MKVKFIRLGALVPSISEQLKDSGLTKTQLRNLDKVANAITLLHLHDYIPEAVTDRARTKLVNYVASLLIAP